MTFLSRLPSGSRKPQPLEVAVEMLRAANALGEPHVTNVENAIDAVYGRDVRMASALMEAVAAGDEDAMLEVENEILTELDVDPNETEQGLTEKAVFAVEDFVSKTTGTEWTYDGSAK